MIVWRIAKPRYADRGNVLEGRGAEIEGGRWNEPGLPLIYTSENSSLALLEVLVHFAADELPNSLLAVSIIVPDDCATGSIHVRELSHEWRQANSNTCIARGSKWARSQKELALHVPSAVNPLERNILLNPLHPDISRCDIGALYPLEFDPRFIELIAP